MWAVALRGTTEALRLFSVCMICTEIGTKWFLASVDGAAMRAGVQTGDRIIKVRAFISPEKQILCIK